MRGGTDLHALPLGVLQQRPEKHAAPGLDGEPRPAAGGVAAARAPRASVGGVRDCGCPRSDHTRRDMICAADALGVAGDGCVGGGGDRCGDA